jgi:hypothetical protein
MKISEATPLQINWLVARLESEASPIGMDSADILLYRSTATNAWMYKPWAIPYSTDWSQGGPIIEREGIDICTSTRGGWIATLLVDCEDSEVVRGEGETPLIAAMRCYCCAKLGDEVDIPEELCPQQNS